MDSRIAQLLDSEDPNLVWDLRYLNEGRPEAFTVFLENCQEYLDSSVEMAVDEHRHDTVEADGDVITHLAKALSVRDLHEEVTKKIPPWHSHPFCSVVEVSVLAPNTNSIDFKKIQGQPQDKINGPI